MTASTDDLERALVELGPQLDAPTGGDLTARVRAALLATDATDAPAAHLPARGWPRGLAIAAAIALAMIGVVAIEPAREAVADLLGIGGVEVRQEPGPDTPPGPSPVPGSHGDPDAVGVTGGTGDTPATIDLGAELADADVAFSPLLPDPAVAGAASAFVTDDAVPEGLVAITYERFTLVALASGPELAPAISKFAGPDTVVRETTVGGEPALWITGAPHQIGYLGADGELRLDSLRRAGDVLVWEADNVTYRIEGARSLAEASAVARSMG